MDDSLEELKRQRALIQQHLEWLDAEIAKHRAKETDKSESSVLIEDSPAVKEEADQAPEPKERPSIAEAVIPSAPQVYGDVKLARIGCVAFFMLGIAGFLFFLFGLPYLLD